MAVVTYFYKNSFLNIYLWLNNFVWHLLSFCLSPKRQERHSQNGISWQEEAERSGQIINGTNSDFDKMDDLNKISQLISRALYVLLPSTNCSQKIGRLAVQPKCEYGLSIMFIFCIICHFLLFLSGQLPLSTQAGGWVSRWTKSSKETKRPRTND